MIAWLASERALLQLLAYLAGCVAAWLLGHAWDRHVQDSVYARARRLVDHAARRGAEDVPNWGRGLCVMSALNALIAIVLLVLALVLNVVRYARSG